MSHSHDGSDQNSGQNFGAGVSQPTRTKAKPQSKPGDQPRAKSGGQPSAKSRGPRRRDTAERPRRRKSEAPVAVAPEPKLDPVEDYVKKISVETETTVAGFEVFDLGKRINRAITEAGYKSPRPIQAESIQPILDGRDILGLAQTGTGKTAAFVLPILHRLLKGGRPGIFPRILVISPTRELTNQIHGEFEALGKYTGVSSMTVFGGVGVNPQMRALRNKPDVRKVISYLPKRRQNLLFSATMPKEIRHLTKEVLTDPVVVELNHHAPVETIEHKLYPVHPTRKGDLLQHMVCEEDFRSAIVFTRTKYRAKNLAKKLGRGRLPRHQLRHPRHPRSLHAPHRPHRPQRARGQGLHLRHEGRLRPDQSHREEARRSHPAGQARGLLRRRQRRRCRARAQGRRGAKQAPCRL